MTTQEIIDYYANLLIMQYADKPRAYATVQTFVEPYVMDQLPVASQSAFDLDTAIGWQLDVIAKYVGATRYGYDNAGAKTLTDAELRDYIKLCITKNTSSSTLYYIQTYLQQYFENVVFVYDYKSMRLSYVMNTSLGSGSFVQFLLNAEALPKPAGVLLSSVVAYPDPSWFFGMSLYPPTGTTPITYNVTPFNTYTSVDTDTHWVSYADAI